MNALLSPATAKRRRLRCEIPMLMIGDRLSATEFLRRWEAMPEVKNAELINGIVHMASPVRTDQHSDPDNLIQTWLGTYAAATPGVRASTNGTVRLGVDDVPQPDGSLRLLPECGGQARVDAKGYLRGAPELVVEVAASSVSVDVHAKLDSYRRAGVREYLVWRTEDECVDWWELVEDEFRHLPSHADGILYSGVFPGLWLDSEALLDLDGARVLAKLHEGLGNVAHTEFAAGLATKL